MYLLSTIQNIGKQVQSIIWHGQRAGKREAERVAAATQIRCTFNNDESNLPSIVSALHFTSHRVAVNNIIGVRCKTSSAPFLALTNFSILIRFNSNCQLYTALCSVFAPSSSSFAFRIVAVAVVVVSFRTFIWLRKCDWIDSRLPQIKVKRLWKRFSISARLCNRKTNW